MLDTLLSAEHVISFNCCWWNQAEGFEQNWKKRVVPKVVANEVGMKKLVVKELEGNWKT